MPLAGGELLSRPLACPAVGSSRGDGSPISESEYTMAASDLM